MGNHFVVQEHTTPQGVHWDLMLERGEILMTFRLPEPPENARRHTLRTKRIFDHAPRFLTYEGPVQKGTGCVRIVARGTYQTLTEEGDTITLDLSGDSLRGRCTLTRAEGSFWQLALRDVERID
jgi:hypothetical protein